jgi:mono/diheme cytochrome c family protein
LKLIISLFIFAFTLNANIENGKDVYAQNCANCHRTDMKGGMGKDFNIVSYNRTKEEIMAYATAPQAMYKQFGYNANAMPKLPLHENDIRDVGEYINSLQPFKKWMKK